MALRLPFLTIAHPSDLGSPARKPTLIPSAASAAREEAAPLAVIALLSENSSMSAAEIIEQIRALPPEERAEVTKFVVETDDSWVPEDFKKSMEDLEAGRVFDMETVISGAPPPLTANLGA
jgi:hypothetical protein